MTEPVEFYDATTLNPILHLSLSTVRKLLQTDCALDEPPTEACRGESTMLDRTRLSPSVADIHSPQASEVRAYLQHCSNVIGSGKVRRAHILERINGILLMEFFHRDGAGLMVSRDLYEGIRMCTLADVGSIADLIHVAKSGGSDLGVSAPRLGFEDEDAVRDVFALEKDGLFLACVAFVQIADEVAGLSALAVQPAYSKDRKNDFLLMYAEREAFARGIRTFVVRTTSDYQWFVERGFEVVKQDDAADRERISQGELDAIESWVDHSAGGRTLIKQLRSDRAVAFEEILLGL
mmetsp:Transcript_25994/g.64958  ORF Transcript_25994/g.64958 Transcript_25994/m.64958 type:complete len:293 (-) Transcript_25994:1257-2135(-)